MATPRVINEISHDTRATLQHVHSRGGYKEIVRDTMGVITDIVIWTDSSKTKKIRETHLTRTLGKLTEVVKKQYDKDANLVETFTQDLDRDSFGKLTDVRLAATVFPTGIGGIPGAGGSALEILSGGTSLGTATAIDFEGATVSMASGVATVTTGAGGGASESFTGTCASDLAVGDLVYAAGASRFMARADPTAADQLVVGIVTTKPTPTTCSIQTAGIVTGLSSLSPGNQVFLGRSGRPTLSPPFPSPGESITLQAVGVALDATSMVLSLTFIATRIRG